MTISKMYGTAVKKFDFLQLVADAISYRDR